MFSRPFLSHRIQAIKLFMHVEFNQKRDKLCLVAFKWDKVKSYDIKKPKNRIMKNDWKYTFSVVAINNW